MNQMPHGVRRQFATKLRYLCSGEPVSGIKSWNGIGNGGRELASGGFRLVLTIEFEGAVCALHAFKKDSARGRKTRRRHSEIAEQRYRDLCAEYAARAHKQ